MAGTTLTKTRIHGGVWEGVLTSPDGTAPEVVVTHQGEELQSVEVAEVPEMPGRHLVRIAIPPGLLAEGVQTFVIAGRASGETLASFAVVTGEPLEDDLRAEIDLLRSELDLLKKAFRRHCAQGA